jgi:glycosyltransferase involved in cell wall biosynthesis
MGSAPSISVVIPVRDGAKYLSEAIESVLTQTYAEFRVHVLENCSKDETQDILASVRDPRVSVIPACAPLAVEENWRRTLDLELMDYLTVLGHDDILYPDFLMDIVSLIRENPKASLYHSHFDIIDEQSRILRRCAPVPYLESAEDFLRARHRHLRDSFGTGYVMRSRDFKAVEGFPRLPQLIYSDDLLWFRLACLGGKVCSPRTLFAYRLHRSSLSRGVGLQDLYIASKEYLRVLSHTTYWRDPTNARLARRFVEESFRGRNRWILTELMDSGDPANKSDYRRTKSQVLLQASQDQLFQVADWMTSLLELIAMIPLPRTLRSLIAHSITWIGASAKTIRSKPNTLGS